MNVLEKEMIAILKILKEEYEVFEIKAEFEAEGSRMEEMMRLKDVTSSVGLPIILKIGGVEAITDIYNALSIGVAGIVAPMAETPYAASKFLNIIEKFVAPDNREDIAFAINIETITAYQNIDAILSLPNINFLRSITVGRVDFSGSLNGGRAMVESGQMCNFCKDIFAKARAKKLHTALGGAISTQTIPFIRELNISNLIDKYETRKVVFRSSAVEKGESGILKAIEFELLWLKSKRRYYSGIKQEDESRIEMLEKRLVANKSAARM